jgi:hypothetical protein
MSTVPAPSGMAPPLSRLLNPPVIIDASEEFFTGPPDGFPMAINTIKIEEPAGDPNDTEVRASLKLCNADGPAVIGGLAGASFLLQLSLYPDAQAPTHLKIPNLPLEEAALGSFAILDAYIPMTNGAITVAFENDPNELLVNLPLSGLLPCATGAPTLTTWGMAAGVFGLLSFGVWRLRRRAFGQVLPL